jgi:small subunit ribosomal protein S18
MARKQRNPQRERREGRRERRGGDEGWKRQRKKVCIFCRDRATSVDFKDVSLLRRFVSDRGKIRARRVTGTCTQHQRDVAAAVKNAREMALLPYASSR